MIWGKKGGKYGVCYAWLPTQLEGGQWAWLEQIGYTWWSPDGHGGCWVYHSLRGRVD